MNNNDYPTMICRTCRHALDVLVDGDGAHYIHTAADADDHEVIPERPQEGWRGKCDFCSASNPTHVLPVRDFVVPDTHELSRGNWCACDGCANLLRDERMDWLRARAIASFHAVYGYPMPPLARAHLGKLYRALQLAATGAIRPLDNRSTPGRDHD